MVKVAIGFVLGVACFWYVSDRGAEGLGKDTASVQHSAVVSASSAKVAAETAKNAYQTEAAKNK